MQLERIDHVAVAVDGEALDRARAVLEDVLGADEPIEEVVEDQGVRTLIYRIGDAKVELLEPTDDDGPVARFLEREGPGLHHLALEVDDVGSAIEHLDEEGLTLLDEDPREGVEGSEIAFLHPRDTFGTLLEVVAFPGEA
jgi:methylmalonyl-CoA/ethylmalonyl-CoA epimerase